MLHYIKRELESLFVHRFSAATMPAFNVIKNSSHYWLLGGLFISYFLYHPLYTPLVTLQQAQYATIVFVIAEFGNLYSHLTLMWLRPPGTTTKGIPRGQLFELVSCANYTWELLAWCAFCYMTRMVTAYIFLIVSTAQIIPWALKKHQALRREFKDTYPRRRRALIPFLL
jgi:very-long-chain enoyl-CoA reductase